MDTNTGAVAEVLPNSQHQVIMDGRMTLTLSRKIVLIVKKNDLDSGPSQLTYKNTSARPLRATPKTFMHRPDTSMYNNQLPNEDMV